MWLAPADVAVKCVQTGCLHAQLVRNVSAADSKEGHIICLFSPMDSE
jgi:hypothetical protein